MKWGFASTAALVLAHQKDAFYANLFSEEVKAVALDWLGKFYRLEVNYSLQCL